MFNLNDYTKGWLVGDFDPALIKSKDIEVGIKEYKKGDVESLHVHNIVTEYTIVLTGKVKMINQIFEKGFVLEGDVMLFRQFLGDAHHFSAHDRQAGFRQLRQDVAGQRFLQPIGFNQDQSVLFGAAHG
jgi:hypothetical protein